jgi:hypothetical protein
MMTIVDLGNEGFEFAKEYLAVGSSLSRALRTQFESSSSVKATTELPEGSSVSRALKFFEGGILRNRPGFERPQPFGHATPNSDPFIVRKVREFLLASSDSVVVIWNYIHRPSDQSVAQSQAKWFSVGDEVYYFLSVDSSTTEIAATLNRAMAIPYLLVSLTHLAGDTVLMDRAPTDASYLEHLAANCEVLHLLAYDGEAYVSIMFK